MGLVCGRSSAGQDPEATHEKGTGTILAEASPKAAHVPAKCPVDSSLALALSQAADLLRDSPVATTFPGGSLPPLSSKQSGTGNSPDPKGSTAHETGSRSSEEGLESKLEVGVGEEGGVLKEANGSSVGAAVGVAEAAGHETRAQMSRPEGETSETAAGKALGCSSEVSGRALSGQRRSFYSHLQLNGALLGGGAAPLRGGCVVPKDRPVNEKKEETPGATAPKRVPTTSLEKRGKACTGVGTPGASTKGQAPSKSESGDEGGVRGGQDARGPKVLERFARPDSHPPPRPKWTAPTVGGRKRCVGPEPRDALVGEQRKLPGGEKEGFSSGVGIRGRETKRSGGERGVAVGARKGEVSERKGNEERKVGGRVGYGGGSGVAESRKVFAERARPASEGKQVVRRTSNGVSVERAGVGFGRGLESLAGRKAQSSSKALALSGDKVTDKALVKTATPRRDLGSRTKALGDGQKRTGPGGGLAASVGSGRRALTPPEGKQRAHGGPKSAGVKNESGLPKGQLRKSASAPSISRTSGQAARASGVRKAGDAAVARRVWAENGPLRSSHVEHSHSAVLEPEIITAPVSRVLRSLARSLSERASEAGATFVFPDEWEGDTWRFRDVGACGACRLSLLERSPYCRATSHGESDTAPDEVSMHSILVCGHFYHSECLERTVFGQGTTDGDCPRCLLPGL